MTEENPATPQGALEFITFHIGEEEYCVDIMNVREIRGWTRATALPHAPHYVRGVINLRGTVLPIIDLSARLGMSPADPTTRHVIIVVEIDDRIVGLLVDAVSDILTVPLSEVHDTPQVASDTAKLFVKGVLAIDERMIRLVDVLNIVPTQALEAAQRQWTHSKPRPPSRRARRKTCRNSSSAGSRACFTTIPGS